MFLRSTADCTLKSIDNFIALLVFLEIPTRPIAAVSVFASRSDSLRLCFMQRAFFLVRDVGAVANELRIQPPIIFPQRHISLNANEHLSKANRAWQLIKKLN